MKRIPLLIILAALLASCASKPEKRTVFTHPTFTQEQYNRDVASCSFEVDKAMLNYRYDASTPWSAGIGRANAHAYAESLFKNCMISKGWEARVEYVEKTAWKGTAGITGFLIRQDHPKPVIISVHPGSPADKQGMKIGDLITEKNGQKITSVDDYNRGSFLDAGEWVEYKVLRGTEELTFKMQAVRVRDLPD